MYKLVWISLLLIPSKFGLCGTLYFKLGLNVVLVPLFSPIHDFSHHICKYDFSNSLILAGNVYQLRKDLSLQRGSIFSVKYGGPIASNLFGRSRSHVEQREVYGLGVRKLSKINRACVHYSSDEYDIDETKVDPVASDEGTGEAILLKGNGSSVSPWWQQLPKRWLIVLLCFTAFLLCNMDRVSILFWYSQSKLSCVCVDWRRIIHYCFPMHVLLDFVEASKCSFCTVILLNSLLIQTHTHIYILMFAMSQISNIYTPLYVHLLWFLLELYQACNNVECFSNSMLWIT